VRGFLGQRGVFFDCVIIYPKVAFVFAVDDLLDSYFVVDVEAIENLKEKWYSNAHVTGSDMRAWINDNADIWSAGGSWIPHPGNSSLGMFDWSSAIAAHAIDVVADFVAVAADDMTAAGDA
jgi:hypothetical protein